MNQAVLGALRAIGVLVFFTLATAVIGLIPDVLTQLPYVGAFITPTISGGLTAAALAYEHKLAVAWGYNQPASAQQNSNTSPS
jgi:hypothetical protein